MKGIGIVIIYMAISVLWVLLSEGVLIYFFKSEVKWLQNVKGSFYMRALMDTEVLDLSNRIKIEQTQADTPGIPLGDIKIVTAKGTKRHIERIHPETSFDEVKKKFIECCQYANVADPEVLWDTLRHNLDFDEVNRLPMIIQ
jgi:hypothetical protein